MRSPSCSSTPPTWRSCTRGDDARRESLPGESAETDEPRLEDVVIIFAAGEMFQLREALEELLGETVDRPDTPATFERALEMYLSLRGAPGTPTVLRRPAILTTPESWEIHIDGTDRATSRAVRAAGRTGMFGS